MSDDAELLRRYASEGSETAFAELVRRHLGFVYNAALRQCGGDAHRAEDVAQTVFSDLARKAGKLADRPVLLGWLYTSTRYAAAQAVRQEARRQAREREALAMNERLMPTASQPEADWERLRPVIDSAVNSLTEREREAVLLRFFDGRSFVDISKQLSVSEDAARMRVDRALAKLHVLLVRRGVTSTTAALGLALSQQTAIAVPAGLAASISSTALIGAAAASGGAAVGTTLLNFMTTTNVSVTLGATVLLCASLLVNAYLLARPAIHAAPLRSALEGTTASSALPLSPRLFADADLVTLRDQLRAAGASEMRVKEVLYGILRRRFREKLTADRAERLNRGWWKDEQRTLGTTYAGQPLRDDPRLVREMLDDRLVALLGPNPLEEGLIDARFSFLPPALRLAFAQADRDAKLDWMATGQPEVDAKIEAEMAEKAKEVRRRREELLSSLTPEQRLEYDLHLGTTSQLLARQIEPVGASEQEFRAVFPIADDYAKSFAGLSTVSPTEAVARRNELEEHTTQKLIATLGYDRALDYIWGSTMEYPAYARAAKDANLPTNTAGRVAQLSAETGSQAAAIHSNPALTAEQRRAALVVLEQTVRPQLDALLPPESQQHLPASALSWLTALREGSYKPMAPILPGRFGFLVSTQIQVSSMPPPTTVLPVLPKRPAGL